MTRSFKKVLCKNGYNDSTHIKSQHLHHQNIIVVIMQFIEYLIKSEILQITHFNFDLKILFFFLILKSDMIDCQNCFTSCFINLRVKISY